MHEQTPLEMPPEPYGRYLRLLGFESLPNGLAGLEELVRRHLCRVPFENVSKLLLLNREGAGRVPTIGEFLDGIEFRDLGGTCYTNNPFLHRLLVAIGYDAQLLGADMQQANVHTVIRVQLGGAAYHIDVGYAAPLRRPITFDEMPVAIQEGELRYELFRNGDGCEMRVSTDSGYVHGYHAHAVARSYDFFKQVVLESYLPGKTFMNCLRITRFFEEHSIELKDDVLTIRKGSVKTQRNLRSRAELRDVVDHDLAMPKCPVEEGLDVLERIAGRQIFKI